MFLYIVHCLQKFEAAALKHVEQMVKFASHLSAIEIDCGEQGEVFNFLSLDSCGSLICVSSVNVYWLWLLRFQEQLCCCAVFCL